jgi:predicted nucleotidyltransferase
VRDSENDRSWVNEICDPVAARLATIEGISGVAFGGARARGTAREDSDVDLALYYDPAAPFSLYQLDIAAGELDERHTSGLVTPLGAPASTAAAGSGLAAIMWISSIAT